VYEADPELSFLVPEPPKGMKVARSEISSIRRRDRARLSHFRTMFRLRSDDYRNSEFHGKYVASPTSSQLPHCGTGRLGRHDRNAGDREQKRLPHSLLELVKLRASLLNHCAFCIDMHFREAKAAGETDQRLALLSAWEETDLYTSRERAALRWTDALTLLAQDHVSDETFAAVRAEFSESELTFLTLAIVTINGWNRFCVGFKIPPGFQG
jgi:AhpD family alkylhydroperoxidase